MIGRALEAGAAGLLLLVLGVAACDAGPDGPPRAGDRAPDYDAATLDGDRVSLADLEGSPLLLNFWATWCTPCRTETPFLQSLHERYGEAGLRVVGVSMDSRGSVEEIRRFADEFGVTYRILHDPAQAGMDRFAIVGLPATFVLDSDGRIRFARIGPVSEEDEAFRSTLEDLTS